MSRTRSLRSHDMMQCQYSFRRYFLRCSILMVALIVVGWMGRSSSGRVVGQDVPSQESDALDIGFGGIVKLGKWVPIFLTVDSDLKPDRFEVTAIDGDDTPIVYSGKLLTDSNRPGHYQAWARFGRAHGKTELRLFDADGHLIETYQLKLGGAGSVADYHDSTRELILTLEPERYLSDAITATSSVLNQGKSRMVVPMGPDDELPLNWLGYDSVKTVVMVTSDANRIRQLLPRQIDALEAWVKKGGTLILSAAQNSEEFLSDGGILQRFSPGVFRGTKKNAHFKRLETFAESREQLMRNRGETLMLSEFSDIEDWIMVSEDSSTPLVIRKAIGLGQVVFTTFDLDSDRLTQWKSFPNLVARLVSRNQRRGDDQKSQRVSQGNSVSHYGFTDLVGQLRVPLDQFSLVRFVNFAWIALLIGIYVLWIGPGDYFFLRKLTGKMELTWITFPLISLLFCGLAFGISKMTRPSSIQLNQLEIIDIDVVDGRTRGSVWTNLYSPSGGSCSIEFDSKHDMGFSIDADVLSWHGLPGDGLGGMGTKMSPGLMKSNYDQRFELSENHQDWHTVLENFPLQVSSTRPLFGQWWSDNPVEIRSTLQYHPKLQQIRGTVENPFDFTLYNCRIVFENWAYVLDQPLGPGQAVEIQTETSEKTLKHLLTRKVKKTDKEDRSRNSPWDRRDTRINRIADMMMFYQAAGGNTYTGLTHGYQPFTDLTDHLDLKRAILIGEVQSVGAVLKIDGTRMSEHYDRSVTIIRMVIPVKSVNDTP